MAPTGNNPAATPSGPSPGRPYKNLPDSIGSLLSRHYRAFDADGELGNLVFEKGVYYRLYSPTSNLY
jgi:hypothetical protein